MNAIRPVPFVDIPEETKKRQLGNLCVTIEAKAVSLPLAAVKSTALVADRIAQTTMEQKFRNEYADPLEAVYIFPLPGSAAVTNFELRVGNRTIRGMVKERGEAREAYQQALDQGKRSALLEQERDDIFTVHVGNLPPAEEVTITLTYSERLSFFENGTTELRLP